MADSYPSHFFSIPRSVVSLKHYFAVHDQPLSRGLIYLVILALIVTALFTGLGVVDHLRAEGQIARELAGQLAPVTFADGKATAAGEQPRVLWVKTRPVGTPEGAVEGQKPIEDQVLVVVLDAAGKLADLDQGAKFAGVARPARILYFGTEKIESFTFGENANEKGKTETCEYTDSKKLDEIGKEIETAGGKMPELKIENGAARFTLEQGKLILLPQTGDLMVLVDTTGKKQGMGEAINAAFRDDEVVRRRLEPPEFLVLIKGTETEMRSRYGAEVHKLAYANVPEMSAETLASWVASRARQARMSATLRVFLPGFVQTVLMLFILSLFASVVGLIASAVLRAGLSFGQVLNMGIYASTPAVLFFLVLALVLQGRGGLWVLGAAVGVAAVYTALGVQTTARVRAEGGGPTI